MRFGKLRDRHPALYGAVNNADLSTGETGELARENVGFGLNPGVELAPPRSLISKWRNRRAYKNLRNVADTGKGDSERCCQDNGRVNSGRGRCGSARWIRTALDIVVRIDLPPGQLIPISVAVCTNSFRSRRSGSGRARATRWPHWSRPALRAQRGRTWRDGWRPFRPAWRANEAQAASLSTAPQAPGGIARRPSPHRSIENGTTIK